MRASKGIFNAILISIILWIFVYLLFVGMAEAVGLQWGHGDPEGDAVTGYNIYYQPADQSAGPFKHKVSGGNTFTTSISNDNFKPGVVNDFWATAVNPVGESDPTAKIQWTRLGFDNGRENSPDTVYILPGSPNQIIIINEK